jgi:aspartyl-tRNA(Asn)/glutamyl-tRNA(Gln) amidotransferase subunit A
MSLWNASIREVHTKITRKEIKPSELVQASLERISATDERVKAFLHVTGDEALSRAQELDNVPADAGLRVEDPRQLSFLL